MDDEKSRHAQTRLVELQFMSPILRTPIANQVNGILNRQQTSDRFCADTEMLLINCLEQYGLRGGKKKCRGYVLDLKECHTRSIQNLRYHAMKAERQRQFKAGERETQYEPAPPLDSY